MTNHGTITLMAKSAYLQARLDPALKQAAQAVADKRGQTMTMLLTRLLMSDKDLAAEFKRLQGSK